MKLLTKFAIVLIVLNTLDYVVTMIGLKINPILKEANPTFAPIINTPLATFLKLIFVPIVFIGSLMLMSDRGQKYSTIAVSSIYSFVVIRNIMLMIIY